jgi:hypothetical protein
MPQRLGLVLLVLALPGAAHAQKTPDRLLPPGSQVYLHWDGFDKHAEAYGKTALAKMMKGDMGKFLRTAFRRAEEQAKTFLSGQVDKELVQALFDDCDGVLQAVSKNGFALGIELRKLEPVEAQGVVVLPGAGGGQRSLPSLLRTILKLAQKDAQEEEVLGRKVQHLDGGPVHLVWWSEGNDAVLAFGTDGPETLLRRLFKGKKSLADQPLYKQVLAFEEFPAWARGYLDLASLAKVAAGYRPAAAKLIDELGLKGLKSITFHSGFDGPAELAVVQLDLAGPRKGLLRLFSKTKFTLADLPPMPPDITAFSADSIEVSQVYPVAVQAVESVVRLFAPDQVGQVQNAIQKVDNALGIKLGDDLFASFGDMAVSYSAWAEGPLGLGQVILIKVKDGDKLEKALATMFQGINNNVPFVRVAVKTRKYHGVPLHEVRVGGPPVQQGGRLGMPAFFYLPTYTVHKGWFALAYYPQPVQGFILRAEGKLPAWKASKQMEKLLAPFPKEMTGISVSDPRPTVKLVLSLAPAVLTAANAFLEQFGLRGNEAPGGSIIDPGLVPNAYEATRYLFPNITVTTDEGNRVRSVTRSSLALPF